MKKILALNLLLAVIVLMFQSCSKCEVINYYYPTEVKNTIDQNIVPIGESFDIEINIPNLIEPDMGEIQNIENEDIGIVIFFQKYKGGELDNSLKPYAFYDDAVEDLDIEVLKGDVTQSHFSIITNSSGNELQTSWIIKPVLNQVQDGRDLKIRITPLIRDTFIIHFDNSIWDSNREDKACADLNNIKFENRSQNVPSYVTEEFDEVENEILERFPNALRNLFLEYEGGTFFIAQ